MPNIFENDKDIVVSTRIRLARNLKDFPFPCRLSEKNFIKINKIIKEAILENNSSISKDFEYFDMSKISETKALSLIEQHLISRDLVNKNYNNAVLITKDKSISIMINEEDHIRIQVMKEGLNLDETYDIADKIDTLLDERLSFAFDEKLGYLTQCPTNLGTGLRASVMLHLPSLQQTILSRISSDLPKLGLAIRGTYGEGSESEGALHQVSNQVTLGLSEKTTIDKLKRVTKQLIFQEKNGREYMLKDLKTLDIIGKSLGILQNAQLMSCEESIKLISNVRLGVSIGHIKDISIEKINKVTNKIYPATLLQNHGANLNQFERDQIRAKIIKEEFSN